MKKSGIYKIKCEKCEKEYIGQSKGSILKRYKEHCNHIKNNESYKSSVAEHVLENSHSIQIDGLKLLKSVNKSNELDANESLLIYKSKDR